MRLHLTRLACLVCILAWGWLKATSPLLAQDYRMLHFTNKEGLPSNIIYEITEDSLGFLWVATQNGLCRFDGQQFKTYSSPFMREDEIVRVRTLLDGSIGFTNLSHQFGIVKGDSVRILLSPAQMDMVIKDFQLDPFGNLWLGREKGASTQEAKWVSSSTQSSGPTAQMAAAHSLLFLEPISFNGLCWNPQSQRMLVLSKLGLMQYHVTDSLREPETYLTTATGEAPAYLEFIQGDTLFTKLYPSRIYPAGDGFVLIEIGGERLILLEEEGPRKFVLADAFPEGTRVFEYQVDHRGQEWLATNRGVYPVQFKGGHILPVGPPILPQYETTTLHIDREQNFWIGTPHQGLFFLPAARYRQLNYPTEDEHFVEFLHRQPAGEIQAMLHTGDLITVSKGKMTAQALLPPGAYKGIFARTDQTAYAYGNTTFWEIDAQGRKYAYTRQGLNGTIVPVRNVKTIAAVGEDIWIGDFYMTYKLDTTRKWVVPITKGRTVNILDDTASGKVWLGNRRGLLVYTPEEGAKLYQDKDGKTLAAMVHSMAVGKDGTLFLGTHGKGLWQIRDHKLERIDHLLKIQAHYFKDLLADGPYIWCSTNTGLYKIDTRSYQAQQVQLGGAMPLEELFGLAVDDSLLWVATSHGITFFPKAFPTISTKAPPIFLEHFHAINQEGEMRINRTLPPAYDQIEINVTSISYAEQISFEFRTGAGRPWQKLASPSLRFSSVRPGKYTYQIRAVRANGLGSTSPLEVRFELLPPFWQNPWLILLGLILTGFLLFWLIRSYYSRRLQRAELQAAMQSEIERSRLESLRAQMNPHFTFNFLNAVQHFLLEGHIHEAHRYLADFAKLIRASLELADKDLIPLHKEIAFLKNYVHLEQLRFGNKLTISWEIDEALENAFIFIPNMVVQPILENAIIHGLNSRKTERHLFIKVEKQESGIRVYVQDNGVGIVQARLNQKPKLEGHESKGMQLLQQRLKWIYQSQAVEARLEVYDLLEDPHAYPHLPDFDTGTLVVINFPNI